MEIIIKMDHDEPVKVNTSSIYGEMHPLPDWDPDKLREDLQELKLENDRLQQREKLYQEFLNFFDCTDRSCSRCTQYCPDDGGFCKMTFPSNRNGLINELNGRLEDIG